MAQYIDSDWAAEYIELQAQHRHLDDSSKWDKRSVTFGSSVVQSPYSAEFVRLLDLQPGDTLFDMGCGNGALAVPLAALGHKVIARDFSNGMLAGLAAAAAEKGVSDNIDMGRLAWGDDWEAAGITPKMVDIAFASRSVITRDLGAALTKLSNVARRKAVVTVSTGSTPMMSNRILRELGVTKVAAYDCRYTMNILFQLGYEPELRYIVTDRHLAFDDIAGARALFDDMLEHAASYAPADQIALARTRLDDWIAPRIEPNELAGMSNKHGEVEGAYKIDLPNDVRWAFISWDV